MFVWVGCFSLVCGGSVPREMLTNAVSPVKARPAWSDCETRIHRTENVVFFGWPQIRVSRHAHHHLPSLDRLATKLPSPFQPTPDSLTNEKPYIVSEAPFQGLTQKAAIEIKAQHEILVVVVVGSKFVGVGHAASCGVALGGQAQHAQVLVTISKWIQSQEYTITRTGFYHNTHSFG